MISVELEKAIVTQSATAHAADTYWAARRKSRSQGKI